MKLSIFLFIFCAFGLGNQALTQKLYGVVLRQEEHHDNEPSQHQDSLHIHMEPVVGAVVLWTGTSISDVTNEKGRFQLPSVGYPANLVVAVPGLPPDTIRLEVHPGKALSYLIKAADELKGVEVRAKTTSFSFVEPRNMQLLTSSDIKKAACCNLSESFETNASVDVNYTDAVSGTKTIRMLGLDGIYSQIMYENIPFIRGLESKYGLTLLPGTWVESIQITKGSGAVTNGYESMTGQINVEFQKPDQNEREQVYANLYLNNMLRKEVNLHYRHRLNKHWSGIILAHGMDMSLERDINGDGFMDAPLNQTLAGSGRLRYSYDAIEGHLTAGGAIRKNVGGQLGFRPKMETTAALYGVQLNSTQGYAMWKNGFLFPSLKFGSLGLTGMVKYYEMDAQFGNTLYTGINRQAYFNPIWESVINNTLHKYRTGICYQLDEYRERLNDSLFARVESVPGLHFEYTYNDDFRWTIVAGIRADFHNLYGTWITPRLHIKTALNEQAAFRFSGGRGFRQPNAIAENLSSFASSRRLVTSAAVNPEDAWNTGASFTWDVKMSKKPLVIRMDYYYTWFVNQLVVNMENPDVIQLENLQGRSYSHAAQVDVELEVLKRFDMNISYRYTLAYETGNKRSRFDLTANFFGYSRLPDTRSNGASHRLKSYSDPYLTLNGQATAVFKYFELYVGGENLLNYIQPNAIIDPQNPFGNEFDASLIWGPLNGIIGYIGIRTTLK